MKSPKHIVMLGTSPETKGGISSVVNVYRQNGLFERFPVIYLSTHADGPAPRKIAFFIRAWTRYMLLLLRGKVALIHVHVATDASFWRKLFFLFPGIAARVRSIMHLHAGDFDEFYAHGGAGRRWIIRSLFLRVDRVIVLSSVWAEWARTVCGKNNVVRIYNPVSVPTSVDPDCRDPACLLFLGKMGEAKGCYDLLEAVARLVPRFPGLRLVMAGDGEIDKVRLAAKALGLSASVELHDWVSGDEKRALLRSAAAFVLPSYCEGMPMSVLESMAVGMPVVTTSVGGIPELVTDGVEGRLVAAGDIDALSEAIETLLSSHDLRRQMGIAARRKVEEMFSDAGILPQLERLYRELGVEPCLR